MKLTELLFGKPTVAPIAIPRKSRMRLEKSRAPAPSINFAFNRGLFASANQELLTNLEKTRDLSRHLTQIDPYLGRYQEVISVFVVGNDGLTLEPQITNANGRLQERVNAEIKKKWNKWCTAATYDEKLSFNEAEQLVIRTTARDGECLVRFVTGKSVNKFGFAIQILDPSLLDITYNTLLGENNIVIMGIEFDKRGKPVAYHVWNRLPSEITQVPRIRERIPADELLHIFDNDVPGAVRALPWTTPVLNTVSRLNQYLEVHLQACSIAATTPLVMTNDQPDIVGVDDVAVSNNANTTFNAPEINLAYSQILELDHGKSLSALNLQFPTQQFKDTTGQYLQSIAAGLFISYSTLTADPAGGTSANVRFNSLVEREHFTQIQKWFIKNFHMKVYKKWIENALLYGAITLPTMDADDYDAVTFRGTRYSTIDPSKDMKGFVEGIKHGLYTRSQIVAEMGGDFMENVKQLAVEEAEIAKYGVSIGEPKEIVDTTDQNPQTTVTETP